MQELRKKFLTIGFAIAATVGTLGFGISEASAEKVVRAGPARTMSWEELIPKNWDPSKHFKGRSLDDIQEGSAAEQDLLNKMREVWDNAPTRTELNGTRLRLPGYVVPLDVEKGRMKEFLLVPYFGACIHTPPPPANQIVHVILKKPAPLNMMDAVWVSGVLSSARRDTEMGTSGYTIAADRVEPYRE